jgi:hypothetical protein
MINALLFATLSLASVTATATSYDAVPRWAQPYRPQIQVWLSSDGFFHRGDRARVYFETETDAYVTIFRIDTDGRVRILFPHDPWQDNYVYRGRRYEVIEPYVSHGKHSFVVDEYPGQGYIFAVASYDPFDYAAFTRRDHWDYRAIAHRGRVTGDPYVAFDELVDRMLPVAYEDYSYDVYPYHVERRYAYPRFLCYDCHTRVAFTYWNPYRYSCVPFRLVIYDDPYYYPARVYVGTRVVYKRPVRYEPRYIFKDRTASRPYITRERRRPTDVGQRQRVTDRGATSRDVGGVGRIPAPTTRTPIPPDSRDGVMERRRVESSSGRIGDRASPSRRAEPADARRSAEPPRRVRTVDQSRGDVRRETPAPGRPQLERREPRRPAATPERVRELRERSDSKVPQARSTPGRSESSRARPTPQRAWNDKPAAQRAPAHRAPSSKQVRPSKRADPRASPSRPTPKRKPKPQRKEKDPKD